MSWRMGKRFVPQSTIDRRVQAKDDRVNRATQLSQVRFLPPAIRSTLTPRELSRVVELLGQGWSLQHTIDRIQAERPTLPFTPPEAA